MRWIVISLTLALCACSTSKSVQPEAPSGPQVAGEEVSYTAGDTTLKGYLAYDRATTAKRPGVLIVHEWWGLNDYARKRADMLAELGYTALAVDMYGDGKNADHPDDAKAFMTETMSDMPAAEARFSAAHRFLQEQPTTIEDDIAAIGYCFGGGVVLHMARRGADLDAVMSFHGSLTTSDPAKEGEVKATIVVATGGADPFVPEEQVTAFEEEMKNAGIPAEVIRYPGVMHSFTNPGATAVGEQHNMPLKYDEAADKDSWARLQSLLNTAFEQPVAK